MCASPLSAESLILGHRSHLNHRFKGESALRRRRGILPFPAIVRYGFSFRNPRAGAFVQTKVLGRSLLSGLGSNAFHLFNDTLRRP